MMLPLSSIILDIERLKPYITKTTPVLESVKIRREPENPSGLVVGDILSYDLMMDWTDY